VAARTSSQSFVNEQREDDSKSFLVSIFLSHACEGLTAEFEVLSAPPAGLSVFGNPIEWATLISAEVTLESLGAKVIAVLLSSQVESFVPLKGIHFA